MRSLHYHTCQKFCNVFQSVWFEPILVSVIVISFLSHFVGSVGQTYVYLSTKVCSCVMQLHLHQVPEINVVYWAHWRHLFAVFANCCFILFAVGRRRSGLDLIHDIYLLIIVATCMAPASGMVRVYFFLASYVGTFSPCSRKSDGSYLFFAVLIWLQRTTAPNSCTRRSVLTLGPALLQLSHLG